MVFFSRKNREVCTQNRESKSGKTILLACDQQKNQSTIRSLCAEFGHQVVEADSCDAAMDAAESHDLKLVLLSTSAPDLDGYAVLEQLRSRDDRADLPVIMIIPDGTRDNIVRVFDSGADDFIAEPVDEEVARIRVKRQLERSLASQENGTFAGSGSNDGVWDLDLESRRVHYSARWQEMLGHAAEDLSASKDYWFSRIHEEDRARVEESLQVHIDGETDQFESEFRVRHADGQYRWMLVRGVAVRGADNAAAGVRGSMTDVTEEKVVDTQTGLPNRWMLNQRAGDLLDAYKADPDCMFGVMCLEVAGLEGTQDGAGDSIGSRLLTVAARLLEQNVSRDDTLVTRLGDDSFALLLDGVQNELHLRRIAQRMVDLLSAPLSDTLGDRPEAIVSVGVAMASERSQAVNDLLSESDSALCVAKDSGESSYRLFAPGMEREIDGQRQRTQRLRAAAESETLFMRYEPIVNLNTERIEILEAKLFWQDAQSGNPEELTLEDFGNDIVGDVIDWMLASVARDIKEMVGQDLQGGATGIPVLLSPWNLQQSIDERMLRLDQGLAANELRASDFIVQASEDAYAKEHQRGGSRIEAIRERGIRMALQDFGAGQSSLVSMHDWHVDVIKLAPAFVERLNDTPEDKAMAQAIVGIATALNCKTIAAGIGEAKDLDTLRLIGVDYGQGPGVAGLSGSGELVAKQGGEVLEFEAAN